MLKQRSCHSRIQENKRVKKGEATPPNCLFSTTLLLLSLLIFCHIGIKMTVSSVEIRLTLLHRLPMCKGYYLQWESEQS